MAQSSAQRDPSMEEILASIRKIIEEGEESRKPAESRHEFEPTPIGPAANDAMRRPLPSAPELRRTVPSVELVEPEVFSTLPGSAEVSFDLGSAAPDVDADVGDADDAVDELSLSLDDFIIDVEEMRDPVTAPKSTVSREAERPVGNPQPNAPVAEAPTQTLSTTATGEPKPNRAELDIPQQQADETNISPQIAEPSQASVAASASEEPVAKEKPTAPQMISKASVTTVSTGRAEGSVVTAVAAPARVEPKSPIVSQIAERKIAASFTELNEALTASRRPSLDQMAEDMLRPMLQDWLDNNLPTLVERLVREEIERVARGAG